MYISYLCMVIGDGTVEAAKIQAMLSPAWGSTARPLLVLSCVSRERLKEELETDAALRTTPTGARCRTPSVEMAQRLRLPQLPNPWMVIHVPRYLSLSVSACYGVDTYYKLICFSV